MEPIYLLYSVDNAVIGIDSLVHARKTFKTRILGHPDFIFWKKKVVSDYSYLSYNFM